MGDEEIVSLSFTFEMDKAIVLIPMLINGEAAGSVPIPLSVFTEEEEDPADWWKRDRRDDEA
jgi:hypothetical protein